MKKPPSIMPTYTILVVIAKWRSLSLARDYGREWCVAHEWARVRVRRCVSMCCQVAGRASERGSERESQREREIESESERVRARN